MIIPHVCNDVGAWGAGFVLALSRVNTNPENSYRAWFQNKVYKGIPFELGQLQIVSYAPNVWVANMVAQRGLRSRNNPVPLSLEALSLCLERLADRCVARKTDVEVHMPRFGVGLAGGKWNDIEGLVLNHLSGRGISVTVYDLPSAKNDRAPPLGRAP